MDSIDSILALIILFLMGFAPELLLLNLDGGLKLLGLAYPVGTLSFLRFLLSDMGTQVCGMPALGLMLLALPFLVGIAAAVVLRLLAWPAAASFSVLFHLHRTKKYCAMYAIAPIGAVVFLLCLIVWHITERSVWRQAVVFLSSCAVFWIVGCPLHRLTTGPWKEDWQRKRPRSHKGERRKVNSEKGEK